MQLEYHVKRLDQRRLNDIIQSVVEYLTHEDRKELLELIPDDDDGLKQLVHEFFIREYSDQDGELILPRILDIVNNLNIRKIQQIRLTMLLNDFDRNRYRVKSVLTRLNDATDHQDDKNRDGILRMLAREELISFEQMEKLKQIDDTSSSSSSSSYLSNVASIIKDTKVGQGINFLPRSSTGLVKKLLQRDVSKKELSAIIEELYQRGKIKRRNYETFRKELLGVL